MAKKGDMGVQRKTKRPFTKRPLTPYPPPPVSSATKKQYEVLLLLSDGLNMTQISRRLNVSKTAIRDRLLQLCNKKLVLQKYHTYSLTKAGETVLNSSKGGSKVCLQKSRHANEFMVDLKSLPNQWGLGNFYFQSLKAKHHMINESTKQAFIHFDDCVVRIGYGKKKTASFFIKNQVGRTFDEVESKAWDVFVKYYKIIQSNGYRLDNRVTSKSQEFANPDGFFARLASKLTNKGFRIDTEEQSFWVDYSEGIAEEETDSLDVAQRMEALASSAMHSKSDFKDLDRLKEIVGDLTSVTYNLVVMQTNQIMPQTKLKTDGLKDIIEYVG